MMSRAIRAGALVPLALGATTAAAAAAQAERDENPRADVIVTGKRLRGSAIGEVAPVAALDAQALRALGATNMKELADRLKPLAQSVTGEDPAYLLNGRRISGFAEVQNLPPEAIERTEILSEQDAPRFGFSPTVRVMNVITKKHFRALSTVQASGTTTAGGGATSYSEASATRIDDARRASLTLSYFHFTPVLQSQRDIAADPDTPFSLVGTVARADGGSIDPRLDALAGRAVTRAAVPGDPALRPILAAYRAAAGSADINPYRTLQSRVDTLRLDGTIGAPLSRTIDASLNINAEGQRQGALTGLAPVTLVVPAGNGALPFADDLLLSRYRPGDPLRQRTTSLTLHSGATVQGGWGDWAWNVTGSYDRARQAVRSDQALVPGAWQDAVNAGADPFGALPTDAATRIAVASRTVTGTVAGKAVANGPVLRLPAGRVQVTLAAGYVRSNSEPAGGNGAASPALTRTSRDASIAATVPIASAERGALGFVGKLSANGTIGVADVSDYGRLTSSSYGLAWAPARPVQVTLSVSDAATAPAIALLTAPLVTTPNVPVFEFATGQSVLATTTIGGNPALAAERRRVTSVGVTVSPIKAREWRVGLSYVDTHIRNQAFAPTDASAALQRAFPTLFGRDAAGALSTLDLRSLNLARERERKLLLTTDLSTPLGRKPSEPAKRAEGDTTTPPPPPPPPPPKPRPTMYMNGTLTYRLDDRVTLRDGQPALDLLAGDTLDGTGGRPRWQLDGTVGGTIGPFTPGLYARIQGPTHARSTIAASDLSYSGRTWLVAYVTLDAGALVARPWAKRLSVALVAENLLNSRIVVRDRTGATPYRYQPGLIDPLGQQVRIMARKLF